MYIRVLRKFWFWLLTTFSELHLIYVFQSEMNFLIYTPDKILIMFSASNLQHILSFLSSSLCRLVLFPNILGLKPKEWWSYNNLECYHKNCFVGWCYPNQNLSLCFFHHQFYFNWVIYFNPFCVSPYWGII